MHPKDADGMANSVDPDQTASSEAVWSWSAQFAETYLSQYIEFVRVFLISALKRKLMMRRSLHELVDQGIYPRKYFSLLVKKKWLGRDFCFACDYQKALCCSVFTVAYGDINLGCISWLGCVFVTIGKKVVPWTWCQLFCLVKIHHILKRW